MRQFTAALADLEPAPDRAQRLEADPDELVIEPLRPYEVGGRRVRNDGSPHPPARRHRPARRPIRGGQTQILRLVRSSAGWQALALPRLDRRQAATLLLPGAVLGVTFLGAPDQPEPSGHLLAHPMEMPLVRLEPPEAAPLPDGRVVPQPWLPLLLR